MSYTLVHIHILQTDSDKIQWQKGNNSFAGYVFIIWTQARVIWEGREAQLKKHLHLTFLRQICGAFSRLQTDMGGPSRLWTGGT